MEQIERCRAWMRRQPAWVPDGVIAGLMLVLYLSYAATVDTAGTPFAGFAGPSRLSTVLALAGTVPLTWRRRAPLQVLAVVGLTAVVAAAAGIPQPGFALLVALYSVALHAPRSESLVALAIFAFFAAVSLVLADALQYAAANALIFVTAWVLGDRQRIAHARAAELEARASELERERKQVAALAIAEERGRIARELHDVVAHGVSVMVTTASGAARALEGDPDRAEAVLLDAERTGRQSLAELRRLLGLLRDGDTDAVLAPQPGVRDLDDLVAGFRRSGLAVDVTRTGELTGLGASVDLSAYRIVQEALTNVLAHAPLASVQLRVAGGSDEVVIDVLDDGEGSGGTPSDQVATHGLIGMRERAALVGGELHAGPRPGGGYAVRARLPRAGTR